MAASSRLHIKAKEFLGVVLTRLIDTLQNRGEKKREEKVTYFCCACVCVCVLLCPNRALVMFIFHYIALRSIGTGK